jgi:hypothetical protein
MVKLWTITEAGVGGASGTSVSVRRSERICLSQRRIDRNAAGASSALASVISCAAASAVPAASFFHDERGAGGRAA